MRLRLRLLAAAVGLTGGLAAPAAGFYFPGWPGSGVPQPRTLIPPATPPEGNPPSAVPPASDTKSDHPPFDVPVPPPYSPPYTPPSTSSPAQTPEPGTLTAALLGLAALGARAAVRFKNR